MGQGILGAIPVSFRFKKGHWKTDEEEYRKKFEKRSAKDFFEF